MRSNKGERAERNWTAKKMGEHWLKRGAEGN